MREEFRVCFRRIKREREREKNLKYIEASYIIGKKTGNRREIVSGYIDGLSVCVCVSIETNTQTTTVDMLTVVQLLPLYNNKLFRTLYPLIEYKKKIDTVCNHDGQCFYRTLFACFSFRFSSIIIIIIDSIRSTLYYWINIFCDRGMWCFLWF